MARVVVAEDNNSLLRLLDNVLTAVGHEVIAASDAFGASQPIDLLCANVAMSGMSGAGLADRLRLRHPHMKVLLINSEESRYVIVDRPDPNSAYCLIGRPFTVFQLVTKIDEMLKSASSAAAAPGPPA
jgi:DNA-binding NtrC family response regulator